MTIQLMDSQAALGFVTSQTSHIETQVNARKMPQIQYPGLIPVDTTAHPFAKSVTYFSSDKVGQAGWINGNAGDIPLVNGDMAKHETQVFMAGIGYGFGLEEVQQAQMLGLNLAADGAMAARRACEEMIDRVAISGDSTKGLEGLINNSSVTVASAVTGGWTAATADQILGDVNAALQVVSTATNYVALSDTLLLPPSRMNLIASRRLGDTSMTILEFLLKNNIYTAQTGQPLVIRTVRALETAGVGSVQRMIAYRRDPEVLKLHMPMAHRFLSAFTKTALYTEVPGIFRLGGLDIRLPKEVIYVDGIGD